MGSARLTKDRRVRRRAEYQHVFERGARAHGRFMTMLAIPNTAGTARLGIVASRKLGDAVRRNRAKRLIREVFRTTSPLPSEQGLDLVVIPKRELFGASYLHLEDDFRGTLKRCAARVARG